jgi:hypothetical protein
MAWLPAPADHAKTLDAASFSMRAGCASSFDNSPAIGNSASSWCQAYVPSMFPKHEGAARLGVGAILRQCRLVEGYAEAGLVWNHQAAL